MGKRKQVKKSKAKNQKASSSSTSGNKKVVAIEDGPMGKKLKKEAKVVTVKEVEVENKSFDDLPTEMVMNILNNVDDKYLFRCRLVNRQFNRVASEILQSNARVELQFEVCKLKQVQIYGKSKSKMSFKELIKMFEDSPNFPCSRLRFDKVQKSFVDHKGWNQLVTDHGDRIKCLILGMKRISEGEELIQITEDLRHLLLNQLPNLQQLGLRFAESNASSLIPLFPKTTSSNSETFQLPHLKTLHLDPSSLTRQSGIVSDLVHAAGNLRKIEYFDGWEGLPRQYNDFQFIQSLGLGKLALLQIASIKITPQLLSSLKENGETELDFKLKELELNGTEVQENPSLCSDATVFISNLFESSKDTLKKITMGPWGFSKDLELPTFSKLINLRIKFGSFPVLDLNFFPLLNCLELDVAWTIAFPQKESVPVIPTLKSLRVSGDGMKGSFIAQISVMCPNLKNFLIWNNGDRFSARTLHRIQPLQNVLEVGRAIWTHLTKLESLKLYLSLKSSDNTPATIDSWITGLSKEKCKRLHHLFCAEKSLTLAGAHVEIPESEWKVDRKNVSILDMTDLRFFTMSLISGDGVKMTKVSERYGLNLMVSLYHKIEREKPTLMT